MPFLIIFIVAAACGPFILTHCLPLTQQSHLAHFPITLALTAYLAWLGRGAAGPADPRIRPSAVGYACLSLLLVIGSVAIRSGWLGMAGTIFGLWSAVDLTGGQPWRDAYRRAFLMSFAMLHPPFGTDQSLIIGLQKIASGVASRWLDLQSIANLTTGVVVRTAENDYLVEEACSGVNSLFASMVLGLFWVLLQRYRLVRSVVFLAGVFLSVLLVNAMRVWSIVYFDQRLGWDLVAEPQHTALGVFMFSLVIGLSLSWDALLRFLAPPRTLPDPPQDQPCHRIHWHRSWVATTSAVGACVFLVGAVGLFRPTSAAAAPNTITDASLMPVMPESVLPEKFGDWTLQSSQRVERDPRNAFGLVSQTWQYTLGTRPVVLSVDGPYDHWHDLGYCYGALGWQLRDSANIDLATQAGQEPVTCVNLDLYKGSGLHSTVMFTSYDATGAVVQPPPSHGTAIRNLMNRFSLSGASERRTTGGKPVVPPVFQIQIRTESPDAMTSQERASLDQFYDFARRRLAGVVFQSGTTLP